MEKNSKIYVSGHSGLAGTAIVKELRARGFDNLILRTHSELDLMDQNAVADFFQTEKPEYVIHSAARVGGIKANLSYPADFLYENLVMQNNVIWQAHLSQVKKLLYIGSSCVYPRDCPQPMKEEYLLDGKPEPTNEAYTIAKIAGLELCRYIYEQYGDKFISCMAPNIYGPDGEFDLENSHVIPALIRRMHEAKLANAPQVEIWGSGHIRREFFHTADLADAIIWMMNNYDSPDFVNVGTGEDVSIRELAALIKKLAAYEGELAYNTAKPDGMPRKVLDVSRINALGWKSRISLEEGLRDIYDYYLSTIKL